MTIKKQQVTVLAFVGTCDACGAQVPPGFYDNSAAVSEMEEAGWTHDPDTEKDYCNACSAKRDGEP